MGMDDLVTAVKKMAPSPVEADLDKRARKILALVETAAARDQKYFNLEHAKKVTQTLNYDQHGEHQLMHALQSDADAEAAKTSAVTLDTIKTIIGDTEIEASAPALLSDTIRTIAALVLLALAAAAGVAATVGTDRTSSTFVVAAIVCVIASTFAFMGYGTLKIKRAGDKANDS